MRPFAHLTDTPKQSLTALALLVSLSACTLPQVNVEKLKTPPAASAALFSQPHTFMDGHATDKGYLATVHVRFGESKESGQISFDIRKEKSDRIVATLWQSEETVTTLHIGYSLGQGASIGARFRWSFE